MEFPFEVQNEKNKNDNWHSIVRYGAGTRNRMPVMAEEVVSERN